MASLLTCMPAGWRLPRMCACVVACLARQGRCCRYCAVGPQHCMACAAAPAQPLTGPAVVMAAGRLMLVSAPAGRPQRRRPPHGRTYACKLRLSRCPATLTVRWGPRRALLGLSCHPSAYKLAASRRDSICPELNCLPSPWQAHRARAAPPCWLAEAPRHDADEPCCRGSARSTQQEEEPGTLSCVQSKAASCPPEQSPPILGELLLLLTPQPRYLLPYEARGCHLKGWGGI